MGGIGEEGAGAPVRATEPGSLEEEVLRVGFGYGWGAEEPYRGSGGGAGWGGSAPALESRGRRPLVRDEACRVPRAGGQEAADRCKRLWEGRCEELCGVQCRGWSVPLIV